MRAGAESIDAKSPLDSANSVVASKHVHQAQVGEDFDDIALKNETWN